MGDRSLYERAEQDPEGYWEEQARSLSWFELWETVLEWEPPSARWFSGGSLNASFNCLDRHVEAGFGDRVAYYFEGEPGDARTITYAELLAEVGRCANALHRLGVERGDRVAVLMPTIPELPVAMLACARIGAVHAVVPAAVALDTLRAVIEDAGARVLLTADGGWSGGEPVAIKAHVDAALGAGAAPIEHVLVVRRLGDAAPATTMTEGRDLWWHDALGKEQAHCPPEAMDSEDLLHLLYTWGHGLRPKGIMHTTGGYLTQVTSTHERVFGVQSGDVSWYASDIWRATGHGDAVYGPLANGGTSVLYEGAPDRPARDRWWSIVEKYSVTILCCDPTAIRAFAKWGPEHPAGHDLSSLRVLGSVAEPIDPETWLWYGEHIGQGRCPVLATWSQGETGAIMISPLAGVTELKPGSATFAVPGVAAEVVNDAGRPVAPGSGHLTVVRPWPAMLRGIYGEREWYEATYWSRFAGRYLSGEDAAVDSDGYIWPRGRTQE